jgi:hypothetical protein
MNGSSNAHTEGATWWQAALMIRGQTETDQRNLRMVWVWTFAWAASFVAVTFALKLNAQLEGPLAWLLAMIPIAVGVPTVRTYLRFIREADEFMRKVQLEGIAIGYAVGSLACIGYQTLRQIGAPELPIVFAVIPLAFGWALGSFLVALRYR